MENKYLAKINNLKFNPVYFLLRQIYKIIFVFPFVLVASLIKYISKTVSQQKFNYSFKNCFIITSVIYPKEKKLSYSAVRSVFSPEERSTQTLITIESIRSKVPEAKIILVEAGLKKDLPFAVADKVNQYIYIGDNFWVRKSCDSKLKSLGETIMLVYAKSKIPQDSQFYFKISGRYFLNEDFRIGDWENNGVTLFYVRDEYMSTRLYGFSRAALKDWFYALIKSIPLLFLDYPIEYLLAKYLPKKQKNIIYKLGVSGADAVTGTAIKE